MKPMTHPICMPCNLRWDARPTVNSSALGINLLCQCKLLLTPFQLCFLPLLILSIQFQLQPARIANFATALDTLHDGAVEPYVAISTCFIRRLANKPAILLARPGIPRVGSVPNTRFGRSIARRVRRRMRRNHEARLSFSPVSLQ